MPDGRLLWLGLRWILIDVLIVGQTPPPYTGYNTMIQRLVAGRFSRVRIAHVRPDLSKTSGEIGRLSLRKGLALLATVGRIVLWRMRRPFALLYYAPSGPERVTMYRDLVVLICVRWLFPYLVLHFHSGGVSELYPRLGAPLRWLFRRAYFDADAAIMLSPLAPPDGLLLQARRIFYVPNGIEDHGAGRGSGAERAGKTLRVLFVAVLQESKGLLVLLEACGQLIAAGVKVRLEVMGEFRSATFQAQVEDLVERLALRSHVGFLGLLTGEAKWRAYAAADVFCFPSYFEGENFPVVVIEAMQFSLPVVATRWRGIPSLVRDGDTGILVPPRDAAAVAGALARLAGDREQARLMGQRGREVYLREYTLAQYVRGVEEVFVAVAGQRSEEQDAL